MRRRTGLLFVALFACRTHAPPGADASSLTPQRDAGIDSSAQREAHEREAGNVTDAPLADTNHEAAASRCRSDRVELRSAPVLDAERGARAVSAYRAFERRTCAAWRLAPGDDPEDLTRLGVQHQLCELKNASVVALASGSFVDKGADEVVLAAENGVSRAEGPTSLILMRRHGEGYEFVRYVTKGEVWKARARLSTASLLDVLVLCNTGGAQGVSWGTCGVFGHGTSAPSDVAPVPEELRDEVRTVDMMTCGRQTDVDLDSVRVTGACVTFDLSVTQFDAIPKEHGEVDGGPLCSGRAHERRRSFPILLELDGSRLHRITPVPTVALEALP